MVYVGELVVEFRIWGTNGNIVLTQPQAYELLLKLKKVFKDIDPPSTTTTAPSTTQPHRRAGDAWEGPAPKKAPKK